MLRKLTTFLSLAWCILALIPSAIAQDIPPRPNPPKLVNDLVGMLRPDERAALEQKLVAYNDSTSTQIVVVIVPTTGDYPPSDYAFKLGETWGVGQKGKNNGIVFLWATETRKIFIATGRGMEGAIPDAIAKRIITNEVVPNFKNQQWAQGINQGIDAIMAYAKGEYKADSSDSQGDGDLTGLIIFIIILVIIIWLISRNKGGGNRYRRGDSWYPYTTITSWGSSSGSGWGGGGGFGGFGGGSFGGGGAGGDY
ncbi:MAG: TPM domain-containing protein [Spirosomataceae bacterium]